MIDKRQTCIIIGAGCAGSACARALADAGFSDIRLIERRSGPGGNAYDRLDEHGVLIHPFGPHIFHTADRRAYDLVSRFARLNGYQHTVVAKVGDLELPVPFNLHSLALAFPDQQVAMRQALIDRYGLGSRVSIVDLRRSDDSRLAQLADYVYDNVFKVYTRKQWGTEQVDPAVLARVPVLVAEDDRYFQDPWQGLPEQGYTAMFTRMLDHPAIHRVTGDGRDLLQLGEGVIYFDGHPFAGPVVYTGALDELFGYRLGPLPYRTLDIVFRHYDADRVQSHGTVNYTVDQDYTRITEFKHMTLQRITGTTTAAEYPKAYRPGAGQDPYYPIASRESADLFARYRQLAAGYPRLLLAGRLAEYRYYNMDAALVRGLQTAQAIQQEDGQ